MKLFANPGRILALLSGILSGLVFLASALLKITSMDQFELYIYAQKIIGFDLSTFFARAIVGIELIMGAFLLLGVKRKYTAFGSLAVLGVFSVFLIVKWAGGSTENCHCFGDAIQLGPMNSLWKNLGLMALIFIGGFKQQVRFRFPVWLQFTIAAVLFLLPFILSPPDQVYRMIYPDKEQLPTDNGMITNVPGLNIQDEYQVMVFATTGCPYCKMAAKKISIIAERTGTRNSVYFVFLGTEETVKKFWRSAEVDPFQYSLMEAKDIIRLTSGQFPSIFFVNNGKIVKRCQYRDLNESDFSVLR